MSKTTILALGCLLLAQACVREHTVELVVRRQGVDATVPTSIEIYDGRVCAVAQSGGVTPRITEPLNAGSPLPYLGPGTYSIAVRARSETDCADVGFGCVEVTIGDEPVVVTVTPTADGGTGCPSGTMCDAGQCVPVTQRCTTAEGCDPGTQVCCNGTCVSAGTSCTTCEGCGAGSPVGDTCCGDVCIDTRSDANNCGSCGNVCTSGSCSGGSCGGPVENLLHVDASGVSSGSFGHALVAYWFQLDSAPTVPEQVIATSEIAGTELVDLRIATEPNLAVSICVEGCASGSCGCTETGGPRIAFGLVRVLDGESTVGYTDAVLVWSSIAMTSDELALAPELGLAALLPEGTRGGFEAYRLAVDGGSLDPAGFTATYRATRTCDTTTPDCPPPLARRP